MKSISILSMVFFAAAATTCDVAAQQAHFPRLPSDQLDITPPSERVRGAPEQMSVREMACRSMPVAETRRRIVDTAAQEWGFFGFPIDDQTIGDDDVLQAGGFQTFSGNIVFERPRRGGRFPALPRAEAVRVASSVAGYWAVTPYASAMIDNQNREWGGPYGVNGRWADPWSAAFVSWVMCEAGAGDSSRFQRAIAHWGYIDQAIRARDGNAPQAIFAAYDIGEEVISPGDLLCSGRRPAYRTIAQRRRQLGVGARTHCDIVVTMDLAGSRILTIGGNVRRSVTLKIFPAYRDSQGRLLPAPVPDRDDERPVFAHLKHRAAPIEADALDNSPTIMALDCDLVFEDRHPAYGLVPAVLDAGRC